MGRVVALGVTLIGLLILMFATPNGKTSGPADMAASGPSATSRMLLRSAAVAGGDMRNTDVAARSRGANKQLEERQRSAGARDLEAEPDAATRAAASRADERPAKLVILPRKATSVLTAATAASAGHPADTSDRPEYPAIRLSMSAPLPPPPRIVLAARNEANNVHAVARSGGAVLAKAMPDRRNVAERPVRAADKANIVASARPAPKLVRIAAGPSPTVPKTTAAKGTPVQEENEGASLARPADASQHVAVRHDDTPRPAAAPRSKVAAPAQKRAPLPGPAKDQVANHAVTNATRVRFAQAPPSYLVGGNVKRANVPVSQFIPTSGGSAYRANVWQRALLEGQ